MRRSTFAVASCAALSLAWWMIGRNQAQLVVALALLLAGILDAAASFVALSKARLVLQSPLDAIAGDDISFTMRASNLRRSLVLSRPPETAYLVPAPTVALIDSADPGMLVSPGYHRGAVHHLVFDAMARGPLGMFHTVRRFRVWLPVPMFVGPRSVAHDLDWPAVRSVRFGSSETAPRDHDVFRGIRPYVRMLQPSVTPPTALRTADRRVSTRRDIVRRLALATYGPPESVRWSGMTRIVSSAGDRWS
jgi:hypothetical protein